MYKKKDKNRFADFFLFFFFSFLNICGFGVDIFTFLSLISENWCKNYVLIFKKHKPDITCKKPQKPFS